MTAILKRAHTGSGCKTPPQSTCTPAPVLLTEHVGTRRWTPRPSILAFKLKYHSVHMVDAYREAKKGGSSNSGGQSGKKKFQNPEANKTVDEIRDLRAEKVKSLREAGKEPFAYAFERSAAAADLQVRRQGA